MNYSKSLIIKVVGIISVAIILLYYTFIHHNYSLNDKNNTLNVALGNEIPTFDPAHAYDTVSASVIYQCYETLFEYHYLKRPYTLKPLLSDGMPRILENNKKYIIKIKNNIRYHDHPAFNGQPRYVKAQDFITQIKRLAFQPTDSSGWWLFDQKIKGLNEFRKLAGNDLQKFYQLNVSGLMYRVV